MPTLQITAVSSEDYPLVVVVNSTGEVMGWGEWSQDPYNGQPGDALRVADTLTDGYAVYGYLSADNRVATTSGHTAVYVSPWVGPNLPENHTYDMTICAQRNGLKITCKSHPVTS
ncbi:hypothetical protein RVR_9684 [Actinacidiphila reveromycinica]|uniref:Uncharacterized protein n=1 Tax=Actinacidiphila reveromycinica TaxID=659352 RepID=A0A7U3V015_9ACTN|nr:hypothetical protein RVR_9684 [Streptomyces sp. SN-593]